MLNYILPHICIILTTLPNFKSCSDNSDLLQKMNEAQIIPLITPIPPKHECEIFFTIGGVYTKIKAGDVLDEYDVRKQPELTWPFREKTYYTLCMIGMTHNDLEVQFGEADSPQSETTERPVMQQWEQWLVINIPGLHINEGNELAAYEPLPLPLENTTDYFVFLIYEQTEIFEKFDDLIVTNGSNEDEYHSIELAKYFAQTQRHTDPWAGSFFVVNGEKKIVKSFEPEDHEQNSEDQQENSEDLEENSEDQEGNSEDQEENLEYQEP